MEIKRICVFCGSRMGARPEYAQAARELGRALARRRIGLVYGGARIGMMGEVARSALLGGAEVIGVIPGGLARQEVAFTELEDLRVVGSMHERKALMAELSDGFIALPGGLGTIEEFFEALTWTKLGIHEKPCGLLNVCRYYDRLIQFMEHVVEQDFLDAAARPAMLIDERPEALLAQFAAYQAPGADRTSWTS
jgi:uncharacterized protein (TIGR00730 family)